MMRMRTKTTELTAAGENEWEVRPGGMLVQKRDPDEETYRVPPPKIRVRVKYGSIYHEIIINSTATFGELKKMLTGPTGLHHEDQKIIYKDKERASKTFLDVVGVKDKSKMVVLEDPISRERRQIEARKNAIKEKVAESMANVSREVERLAGQVSALESVISKGGKVADKTVSDLIDLLMNQLLKLDEIKVEGDVNRQKKLQVEKVQRYVETLDALKVKNTTSQPRINQTNGHTNHHNHPQSKRSVGKFAPPTMVASEQQAPSRGGVVVTTQWETFDSLPTVFPAPQTSTSTTSETPIQHNFNWDLLLK
ncbi:BAG family molecular chaperone regulator 2-like [Bidens hawaiensis]|uniref:BAG family molecular chaperone regulator 2-like n=1 Tax=Bidens hawaiensis TaxID=980011 RepID=UPI0040496F53